VFDYIFYDSTHCRCRGLLLHLLTLGDKQTRTRYDFPERGIGPSQTPLPHSTTFTAQTFILSAGFEAAFPAIEQP